MTNWEHPFTYPDFNHTLVQTPDDLNEDFYNILSNSPVVAFDFETTGTHYIKDRAVGVSFANEDRSWYLFEPAMQHIIPWMKDQMSTDKLWVAHNIKFEMHFTSQWGFIPKNIFDTMVAQWTVNETLDSFKLKEMAKVRFDVPDNLPGFDTLLMYTKKLVGKSKKADVLISDIPPELLGVYGAYDSRLAFDLYPLLVKELHEEEAYDYFINQSMLLTKALMSMERNGIRVDLEKVAIAEKELQAKVDQLRSEFEDRSKEIVGYAVNPNSVNQKRELLFDGLKLKTTRKTKSGEMSTDALTLLQLSRQDKSGVVDLLIEYSKVQKIMSTYVTAIVNKNIDGRMYADFNQTGTVTGRLSSSGDTNLQNQPSRGEYGKLLKGLYIADDGSVINCSDYSQMELRLTTHYTRDPIMVKSYLWGTDIHQLTADRLGVPRYIGKTINFGIIYGAYPITICNTIEKDGFPRPQLRDAKRWMEDYFNLYKGIKPWENKVHSFGRRNGYVETIAGRRRHVMGLNHWDEYARGRAERQAVNSIIQGSAGDAMNWTMVQFYINDEYMRNFGATMNIQVHDELVFNVPEETKEPFKKVTKKVMESVREQFGITIPIVAEPNLGKSWLEAK